MYSGASKTATGMAHFSMMWQGPPIIIADEALRGGQTTENRKFPKLSIIKAMFKSFSFGFMYSVRRMDDVNTFRIDVIV